MNHWVIVIPCIVYFACIGVYLSPSQAYCVTWFTRENRNWNFIHLPGLTAGNNCSYLRHLGPLRRTIHFDDICAQHPPHAHDCYTTDPAQKEYSRCHGCDSRRWRIVQGHHHRLRRILCPLGSWFHIVYDTVGRQEFLPVYILANRCSDRGSWGLLLRSIL